MLLKPAGTVLRLVAERVIAEFDDGLDEFVGFTAGFTVGRRDCITVAALPSVAVALLPPPLTRFRAEPGLGAVLIVDAVQQRRANFGSRWSRVRWPTWCSGR